MIRNPPPPTVTREDRGAAQQATGWLGVPVAIALLLGAWIAMATAVNVPFLMPQPAAVLATLSDLARDPAFPRALGTTLLPAVGGFLIALFGGGVAAAVFAGPLRLATLVLLGVPAAAVVPLAIIWFGFGLPVAFFGAAMLAFGPIAVGFAADGAARRPAAVVGAAMALNGAVVAELVGSQEGLGYRLMQATAALETAKVGAMILVLAAIGMVAVLAVHTLFAVFVPDDRAP